MLPSEPTIVFAGAQEPAIPLLAKAEVDAIMVSYMVLNKSKRFQATMRDLSWKPRTYLDSGVFTFLRRAGLSYQSKSKKDKKGAATWDEFKEFAREFILYTSRERDTWDHIVELDVDELFGVDVADAFRRKLRSVLGDKLLPVWHAQRGPEGWTEMVNSFEYVCLSPTKVFSRTGRTEGVIRQMLTEAKDAGCKVHILGVEQTAWFDMGATTIDASSWSSGARWGQFKLAGDGAGPKHLTVPVKAIAARRRALSHSHIRQFEDLIAQWGFTLDDLQTSAGARQVGIYLLQQRQEAVRARFITTAAS